MYLDLFSGSLMMQIHNNSVFENYVSKQYYDWFVHTASKNYLARGLNED